MVVQKQWTYNRTTGQCVEFSYHPCGQDREGYDVFKTELECTQTCVQQGIHGQYSTLSRCHSATVYRSDSIF